MRTLLFLLSAAFFCQTASAQTELSRNGAPSKNWTMISVHKMWTPQHNDFPNGGFGVNSFFSVNSARDVWVGFALVGTGLHKRDALLINGGVGWWMLGDSHLGMYSFATTGLGITSNSGLTGFNFFSDPTTTFGLASQGGLGGSIELFTNFKFHLNTFVMWFTNDGGLTPFGVQLGLTLGGR